MENRQACEESIAAMACAAVMASTPTTLPEAALWLRYVVQLFVLVFFDDFPRTTVHCAHLRAGIAEAVSICPGGFNVAYTSGVCSALRGGAVCDGCDRDSDGVTSEDKVAFLGISTGGIAAVSTALGADSLAWLLESPVCGRLARRTSLMPEVEAFLLHQLPHDAAERCSGRVALAWTELAWTDSRSGRFALRAFVAAAAAMLVAAIGRVFAIAMVAAAGALLALIVAVAHVRKRVRVCTNFASSAELARAMRMSASVPLVQDDHFLPASYMTMSTSSSTYDPQRPAWAVDGVLSARLLELDGAPTTTIDYCAKSGADVSPVQDLPSRNTKPFGVHEARALFFQGQHDGRALLRSRCTVNPGK